MGVEGQPVDGGGLRGKALAATLGVTEKEANDDTYENKMRAWQGFGAYVLALHGRPYCPDLARILDHAAWDGESFTRVLRLRILRHLDTCKTCDNCATCKYQRDQLIKPYAPVLIPILVAADLRERVLQTIRRIAETDPESPNRKKKPPPAAVAPPANKPKQQEKKKSFWDRTWWILVLITTIVRLLNNQAHPHPNQTPSDLHRGGPPTTLNVWVPGRGVRVLSEPAAMNCVAQTATDSCHARFPAGTQVTLTAVISQSERPLIWLGCGNRPTATQPCTVVLTQDTAVCVVSDNSPWTIDICRGWAAG